MPLGGGSSVGFGASGSTGWEKIVDETLIAAATSIDVTSLDLDTDALYKIYLLYYNPTGATNIISCFFNGDTTATNYDYQSLTGSGAAVSTVHGDNAQVCAVYAGRYVTIVGDLSAPVGANPIGYWEQTTKDGSDMNFYLNHLTWTAGSGANVNRITFTGNQANGFGIGTRLIIFKVVS